jgi:L-seryl-tRNA(Ser) seleniumtransferase
MDAGQILARAEALLPLLAGTPARIVEGFSVIGGGSTPEQALPTYLIAVESGQVAALERRLREGDPAVVARIEDERLLLDLRTVLPEEEALLVKAVLSAAGS